MEQATYSDTEHNFQNTNSTASYRQQTSNMKQMRKYARRMAVSQFVEAIKKVSSGHTCCGTEYAGTDELYRHINTVHSTEITTVSNHILDEGSTDAKWKVLQRKHQDGTENDSSPDSSHPHQFTESDEFPWLPIVQCDGNNEYSDSKSGRILLFYRYCHILDTEHVRKWQETLCSRLQLTGKVRVASEGLNGTVTGTVQATETYMESIMKHPSFSDMTREQFKTSEGTLDAFPGGLCVGVYAEAVPMGMKPDEVSYKDSGVHLSPEEFHKVVLEMKDPGKQKESVLIDCRNFYESKIGRFDGAIAPDIRKFSYWPDYIDQNEELFRNKKVYMYCTGGIRCERGSAYLKSKGLGSEVFQLEGGIHKYAEKYPDGLFKGKLFVFDNRYAMPVNDNILSECVYCGRPWDDYSPCSRTHCYQLVLSCTECKSKNLTACCATCQEKHKLNEHRQECDCTRKRERVPKETPSGHSD